MDNLMTLVAPIVAVGAVYVVAPVIGDAYRRFRGTKIVTCPETHAAAKIQLDAATAAASAALGKPLLEVTTCSRWLERHYCGKECLAQLK